MVPSAKCRMHRYNTCGTKMYIYKYMLVLGTTLVTDVQERSQTDSRVDGISHSTKLYSACSAAFVVHHLYMSRMAEKDTMLQPANSMFA